VSDRVNIAELRAQATGDKCVFCGRRAATDEEWESVNEGERPDLCWGPGECELATPVDARNVSAVTLLALLDAVEAARGLVLMKRPVSGGGPLGEQAADALARFDFGDAA
jgi:hypothetical protein